MNMTNAQTDKKTIPTDPHGRYASDGFYIAPQVVPADAIEEAIPHMDAVRMGEYETGVPPLSRMWNVGDPPDKLCKIDMPHLADRTIHALISHPAIGQWAAAVTGASWVQVWHSQLLYKPPSTAAAATVGFHQDKQYWRMWEGEVFTCWLALSDVREDCGPMRYVTGSNHWGLRSQGNFFAEADDLARNDIELPEGRTWEEVPVIVPPGGASFHTCLTYHGSGPNHSAQPRRSFAIHLRTEKSKPIKQNNYDDHWVDHLDDPAHAPVIYGG